MKRFTDWLKGSPKAMLFAGAVKVSSLFKTSIILGSKMAFFSGVNIAMPLIGAFSNRSMTLMIFIARLCIQFFVFGFMSLHILAYHIPGFFAAFYWNTKHWSIRLLLPAACMVLFGLHPVGFYAFAYALYWLIPIALYFISYDNKFLTALGSTFTAHAVGSVIWLYTVPMTSAMWLSLIPVVFVERLLFASGMVLVHSFIQMGAKQLSYLRTKFAVSHPVIK